MLHALPLPERSREIVHLNETLFDMLAVRLHQLELGHTPAADDARDLFEFSKGAGRLLHRMNETASLHRIDQTRRDAVRLAAYCWALAESCHRRLAALNPATLDQPASGTRPAG